MANPLCPTDCTSLLPVVKFSNCAPEISLSEITKIYVTRLEATPFTDWKVGTEWVTRINESGTDPDAIRTLIVIGDKPASSPITKEISNGRNYTIGKDHTLNVRIDDVSDENYEFMRATECGGQYKIWYETAGGKLYGGNEGISASLVFSDILASGRDSIEELTGTITWRDKFHPERIDSPIA